MSNLPSSPSFSTQRQSMSGGVEPPTSPTTPTTTTNHMSQSKLRASTSFFTTLLTNGYIVDIYKTKKQEFRSFLVFFSPESCALISYDAKQNPTNYISLRKFALSFNPNDPNQITIKTPNCIWKLRFKDIQIRSLFCDWLKSVEADSSILAQNALLLATSSAGTVDVNDINSRQPWYVPSEFCDFCANCHNTLSSLSKKSTCRDCGYVFCVATGCFTPNVKRCNHCLVNHNTITYEGKRTGKEPVVPTFDPNQSTTTRSYFGDVVSKDPMSNLSLQQPLLNIDENNTLTTEQPAFAENYSVRARSGSAIMNSPSATRGRASSISKLDPGLVFAGMQSHNNKAHDEKELEERKQYARREERRAKYMADLQATAGYQDAVLIAFVCILISLLFWDQMMDIISFIVPH